MIILCKKKWTRLYDIRMQLEGKYSEDKRVGIRVFTLPTVCQRFLRFITCLEAGQISCHKDYSKLTRMENEKWFYITLILIKTLIQHRLFVF